MKYNLFFSLGEACSSSTALRSNKLQKASYPFDWVAGGTILDRVNILCSEFDEYFEKEDLKYHSSRKEPEPKDIYFNSKHKMIFNHDFTLNGSFVDEYPKVRAKYNRRAKRLIKSIKDSKKILVLYLLLSEPKVKFSEDIVLNAYNKLTQTFGNKFDFLILRCNLSLGKDKIIKKQINNNITLMELDYKTDDLATYDIQKIDNILKDFELKLTLKQKIKKLIFSILNILIDKNCLTLHIFLFLKARIMRVKIYIFKKQLDICIGSNKPIKR